MTSGSMGQALRAALLFSVACAVASTAAAAPMADPRLAKVSRRLLDGSGAEAGLPQGAAAAGAAPAGELDIRLSRLTPEIVEQARAAGLEIIDADLRYARILGTCPADCLAALASIPEVTSIHPNYGAVTMSGNVVSQADTSIGAAEARQTFDLSGAGVRIGLISDTVTDRTQGTFTGEGCDRRYTSTNPSHAAELPQFMHIIAEPTDLPGVSFGGIDEGRAMAELVHDLAPGAELFFHTAFTTPAIFARGIEALADCGVDVIVDDVIYFAEPMFQDGIIAQAAEDAIDRGILFFSAIGNLGNWGVDEHYSDADPEIDDMEDRPSGSDLHRFANGTTFAAVTVPRRCGLRMVLQWNEPFSGTLGAGASTDLDLYACTDANPLTCVPSSASRDAQGCAAGDGQPSGDPLEILDVTNSRSGDRVFYIAVEHVCGNEDVRFRIASFSLSCNYPGTYQFDPAVFDKSQAYGHPVAAGVVSTAAVFYGEIDANGDLQGEPGVIDVEPFSSLGGEIPIYLDRDGVPLANGPVLREAPLLAAPDGTNTSFFGLRDEEGDGFLNFFGTSAAAPHAAAIAALMLEADPDLESGEAIEILRATARDVAAPGPDPRTGSGLVDAVEAIRETLLRSSGAPTATPTATQPTATPTATAPTMATRTPTDTATATPTFGGGCPGDCNGDGRVTIAELVVGVRIALGESAAAACRAADIDGNGVVAVNEIVQATLAALLDC